jgi:hypothetical protein
VANGVPPVDFRSSGGMVALKPPGVLVQPKTRSPKMQMLITITDSRKKVALLCLLSFLALC